MLVAEQRSVEWEVTGLSALDGTGTGTLQVRVLNTGNTPLSHQLVLDTSTGLEAAIVGDDIVSAVSGDSQQFTIQVNGKATGVQQLTFQLSGVQEVQLSTTSINIEITSSFEESGSSGSNTIIIGSGIAVILGFAAMLLILRNRNNAPQQMTAPVAPSPMPQQHAPTCWSCRNPIVGPMKGCPGCGARYHADSPTCTAVESCTNCGASSEQFVSA
jgi:hypothetical protein